MAGVQYSFFPTDFFYPRASPPSTSLVAANPKVVDKTQSQQKRDGLVVIDKTRASLSLQLVREKTTTNHHQSQTWKNTKPLWIEDDM
ncbi:hypothetical protein CARUB_v10019634mg [Capsella rubella]|uniref:Uncharacterized protein n=1 Tax=Capsella rubella TaxID=81985 RepID=R0FUG9_9BRAS|nr:hypothetical protein CARUB_v10019634mg [Capsella rubella]